MFGALSNSPENLQSAGAEPARARSAGAQSGWRNRLYIIIFEHNTPGGKAFDVALLVAILASVVIVMLESVASMREQYGAALRALEWALTIVFTVEYVVRIASARRRWAYVFSFLGVIDLLAIVPTYLSLFLPGSEALLTIRALRLLRVFRVLKLSAFLREADSLGSALQGSVRKIIVFLGVVLTLAVIMGTLIYLIEDAQHGFTSIPRGVYWAIVTMTTVGYGDVVPHTVLGQILATIVMILGYGIIAVPTGIVSVELAQHRPLRSKTVAMLCSACRVAGHDYDAKFCKHCGISL